MAKGKSCHVDWNMQKACMAQEQGKEEKGMHVCKMHGSGERKVEVFLFHGGRQQVGEWKVAQEGPARTCPSCPKTKSASLLFRVRE